MILIALLIGIVLVVAAIRGTEGSLLTALGQDVPAFVVWGAAIVALGAIGYVPALRPVSRGLLVLILIVIVLRNYQGIISGFSAVAVPPAPSTSSVGQSGIPTGSGAALGSLTPSISSPVATPSVAAPTVANPGNLNNLTVSVGPYGSIMGSGIDFIEDTAPSGFANEYFSRGAGL